MCDTRSARSLLIRVLLAATAMALNACLACVVVAWLAAALPYERLGDKASFVYAEDIEVAITATDRLFFTELRLTAFPASRDNPVDLNELADEMPTRSVSLSSSSVVVVKRFGWPFRCLGVYWICDDRSVSFAGEGLSGGLTFHSIRIHDSDGQTVPSGAADFDATVRNAIPLDPLWAGLGKNLLVYLIVMLLIYLVVSIVACSRKFVRKLQSACTRCGYCIAGLSRCPECGNSCQSIWNAPRYLWASQLICCIMMIAVIVGILVWRAVTVSEMSDLHLAAANGNVEQVRELLERGYDVDAPLAGTVPMPALLTGLRHGRPLAWAVARGRADVVSVLLDHGADPSADDHVALRLAQICREVDIQRVLEARLEESIKEPR